MAFRLIFSLVGLVTAYRAHIASNVSIEGSDKCSSSESVFNSMKSDLEKGLKKSKSISDPKMIAALLRASRMLKVGVRKECEWVASRAPASETPFMSQMVSEQLAKQPCATEGNEFMAEGKYILAVDAFIADADECDKIPTRPALEPGAMEDIADEAAELEVQLMDQQGGGVSLLDKFEVNASWSTVELILIIILFILFSPILIPLAVIFFVLTAIICILTQLRRWGRCMRGYWRL